MKNTSGILLHLFLLTRCFLLCLATNTAKVQVHSGEIAGRFEYTYNGRKIYSFLGIPYASPPVQNYRFKEPQPVKPWLGVWNATIPGSACLGPDYESDLKFIGQEDCLYLNVYTPKLPRENTPGELMNVIVYIHGGAFIGGEGILYGPDYLLDTNDFVYVSIKYNPFSPFGPTVEVAGDEKFLPDFPEKLVPYDIPVLMSVTQDEGLSTVLYIAYENGMNELNNNWNDYLPHLLDYNYTISNENLRFKTAQDIKEFYFGDKPISKETKSNLSKV